MVAANAKIKLNMISDRFIVDIVFPPSEISVTGVSLFEGAMQVGRPPSTWRSADREIICLEDTQKAQAKVPSVRRS